MMWTTVNIAVVYVWSGMHACLKSGTRFRQLRCFVVFHSDVGSCRILH